MLDNVIVLYSSSPQNPAVKIVKLLEINNRKKKIRMRMMNKTQLRLPGYGHSFAGIPCFSTVAVVRLK